MDLVVIYDAIHRWWFPFSSVIRTPLFSWIGFMATWNKDYIFLPSLWLAVAMWQREKSRSGGYHFLEVCLKGESASGFFHTPFGQQECLQNGCSSAAILDREMTRGIEVTLGKTKKRWDLVHATIG